MRRELGPVVGQTEPLALCWWVMGWVLWGSGAVYCHYHRRGFHQHQGWNHVSDSRATRTRGAVTHGIQHWLGEAS